MKKARFDALFNQLIEKLKKGKCGIFLIESIISLSDFVFLYSKNKN